MVCVGGFETLSRCVLGLGMFLLEFCCFGEGKECIEGNVELELAHLGFPGGQEKNKKGGTYGVVFEEGSCGGEMSWTEGKEIFVYWVFYRRIFRRNSGNVPFATGLTCLYNLICAREFL